MSCSEEYESICDICELSYKIAKSRHLKSVKCLYAQHLKRKIEEKFNNEINELKEANKKLKLENDFYKSKLVRRGVKFSNLSDELIVSVSSMSDCISKICTYELLYDYAYREDVVYEKLFKELFVDGKGKFKVVCTDIARKKFYFREFKSNQIICDPELSKLSNFIFRAAKKTRDINLYYLFNVDDDEESMKEMNRKHKASNILNFDQSFVNFMAKRAYACSIDQESIKDEHARESEPEFDDF